MTKRIFSILLALCMVFAFMPASAFAANSDTDITISVDKANVNVGDTVTVTVHIPAFDTCGTVNVKYTVPSQFKAPDYGNNGKKFEHENKKLTGIINYNAFDGCMSLYATDNDQNAITAFDFVETFTVVGSSDSPCKFEIKDAIVADYMQNYATTDESTKTATVTVAKAKANLTADDFNITVPTDTVYGGSTAPVAAPTIKDSSKKIGAVTVKYNGTTEEPKVAGTYHVTFDVAESADYNAAKDLEIGTFKITQKELKMTAKAESRAYEEGNTSVTLKDIALDGIVGNDEVSVDATKGKATVDTADAGTGKVVTLAGYELTGEQAGNYQLLPPTGITVDITKADFAGTTTHTEKATKGSTVTCDIVKDLKLPADANLRIGTVSDSDNILDGNPVIDKGILTFKFKADAATGKTATIPVTVTSKNYKDFDITITAEVKDAGSTGGGGGGIIIPPIVQNPEIKLVEATMGKAELSADGTTATITPNDGYEIDKVTVNEKEVAFTGNKITGLKAGDKVVVTFKAKAAPEPAFDVQKYVSDLKLVARSTKTAKGNIKVAVKTVTDQNGTAVNLSDLKDKGYTVKYKFYRSNKKVSKYAAKTEKTIDKNSYVNTTGKKGTKYFYKVRVMVYDNDGKLVAKSELKQCKYASRTWTKK